MRPRGLERALNAFLAHNEEEALARLFDMWERTRAPRLVALLTRLSTRLTARFTPPENSPWRRASTRYETTDLPRRIERFRGAADDRRPRRLDEVALSHCDALERALSERESAEARLGPTLEALFAQVYENPDDDAPRLVLADALMELGDPRGRHMMHELRGEPELARECARDVRPWLFPLGPYGDPQLWCFFERGFPAVISPEFPRAAPLVPPGPAWGTIREIALGYRDPPRELADWLIHPNLRRLEALQRVAPTFVRELCSRPLRVKRIELENPGGGYELRAEEPDLFTHLSSLPRLERVDIRNASPEYVSLCASSPLATRLERFTAEGDMGWSLVATPSGEVTVEAWLRNRDGVYGLAPALLGAALFGTRTLRLHVPPNLDPAERELLTEAVAPYSRVEWA